MQITFPTITGLDEKKADTASLAASTESEFAAYLKEKNDAEDLLEKITSDGVKGLMQWKIEQMKKQITEQVMASKGLTADGISSLPPAEKMATEETIMKEVQEKLKEAINEQMKRENNTELGFMSPKIEPEAMAQMLAAQEATALDHAA